MSGAGGGTIETQVNLIGTSQITGAFKATQGSLELK